METGLTPVYTDQHVRIYFTISSERGSPFSVFRHGQDRQLSHDRFHHEPDCLRAAGLQPTGDQHHEPGAPGARFRRRAPASTGTYHAGYSARLVVPAGSQQSRANFWRALRAGGRDTRHQSLTNVCQSTGPARGADCVDPIRLLPGGPPFRQYHAEGFTDLAPLTEYHVSVRLLWRI